MRASKVYTSACILHDRYWHVSGDRLGWFGGKFFHNRCLGMGAYSLETCIHTHIHTTHTYMHTHIHACIHTCTCKHTYTHLHAYTHMPPCTHTYTHTHMHTHSHAYTDMHACILAHACTHSVTCTHTYTQPNHLPKVNRLWVPGPCFFIISQQGKLLVWTLHQLFPSTVVKLGPSELTQRPCDRQSNPFRAIPRSHVHITPSTKSLVVPNSLDLLGLSTIPTPNSRSEPDTFTAAPIHCVFHWASLLVHKTKANYIILHNIWPLELISESMVQKLSMSLKSLSYWLWRCLEG